MNIESRAGLRDNENVYQRTRSVFYIPKVKSFPATRKSRDEHANDVHRSADWDIGGSRKSYGHTRRGTRADQGRLFSGADD